MNGVNFISRALKSNSRFMSGAVRLSGCHLSVTIVECAQTTRDMRKLSLRDASAMSNAIFCYKIQSASS